MSLNAAQQALAAHLAAAVAADPIAALVPAAPQPWQGYVWSASDWISTPDDAAFCATRSVGLVLDLVAGTVDLEASQEWLNDRIDEVWAAGPAEVLGDEIVPESAPAPSIVRTDTGTELLVARVEFSRFTLED